MNIAITGGGTGGHLTVAKSVAEELNKRGIKPIFIGSTSGQDKLWFENSDLFEKTYFLDSSGVVNKRGLGKIKSLINILICSFKTIKILERHDTKSIFSVGGFSSAPATIASIITQKKLYIHEQNAATGTLNKIFKPFAKEFFSSYDENSKVKAYPIREIFFEEAKVRKKIKRIIFLGGSQGAMAINDLAISMAKDLLNMGIKVIHQCGKNDIERVAKYYKENKLDVDYFDFSTELEKKIIESDFAISRAGASTLWELSSNGIVSIYIPYPYAANDHQYHNAKFLVDKELSYLYREDKIDITEILEIIKNGDIAKKSKELISISKRDASKNIVNIILGENDGH